MEMFKQQVLSDRVIGITDIADVNMFLVLGDEAGALIDTGSGLGDLYGYVSKITDLPLKVILTHGHVDHVGCAYQFQDVYLHPLDLDLMEEHAKAEVKKGYIQMAGGERVSPKDLADIQDRTPDHVKDLEDGQVFDLGGIRLEIVHTPGHTGGMCTVLIREEEAMIYGDACNERVFLFGQEATSLATYRESLKHLKTYDSQYKQAWFSHGPLIQTREILEGCYQLTEEIMNRQDDKLAFNFMGMEAYAAKATGKDGVSRKDGLHGNIIYSTSKL